MLRPATREDSRLLFHWANAPEIRSNSFNAAPITWEEHVAWLDTMLADPAKVIWLSTEGSVPVASIRFEAEGQRARVSVQVSPDAQGKGIGSRLISEATALYVDATGRTVEAEIKADNVASIRAFESAGYSRAEQPAPGVRRYLFPA